MVTLRVLTPAEALNANSRARVKEHMQKRCGQDSPKKQAQRDKWVAVWVKRLLCEHPQILSVSLPSSAFQGVMHSCRLCGATGRSTHIP